MPLHIVHNDITEMDTDIIVNAANSRLLMGSGVCGAIFNKSGAKELQKECDTLSPISVGEAVITQGYNLKAKYIIHAVGPIYNDGNHHERELLENAYSNSLLLAIQHKCSSISFPLISSGIYGYPKEEALQVAVSTISKFLLQNELDVYIVVYDRTAVTLSEKLFTDIQHYIDTFYEPDVIQRRNMYEYEAYSKPIQFESPKPTKRKTVKKWFFEDDEIKESRPRSLDELISAIDETFSEMLLRLIDEKGYTDVEVYKRANMDRKLFSKIRTNPDYHPSKRTCLSLAIALRLSMDETIDLLDKAGYSLSNSQRSDIIIKYFIDQHEYNIYTINEALFYFNEPIL